MVIKGDFSIADIDRDFLPMYENDGWFVKIEQCYVEHHRKDALLPVIVVEEGHTQKFYIKLSRNEKNHSLTIRLDPTTDPVKTRGVKRSLALVTESIVKKYKEAAIVRHNLQDYLLSEDSFPI